MAGVFIQFVLDEFKSTGKIPAFTDKISTVRKYGVSIIIILQSYAQLEIMYDKESSTIMSNCPIKILMGTSDEKTIKAFTATVGKRTTTVENTSYQANGNGSSSYNKSSLELITPDAVAELDFEHFYVMIDGEKPYYGKKFFVQQHPRADIAKKTEGQYFNKNAGKSKPLVPLRLRQEQGEDSDRKNTVPKMDKPPVQKKPENTKPKDPKNGARKKDAEEAKETVEMMDNSPSEESGDMLNQAILADMGVTAESTDTQIKETIESTIILDNICAEDITYGMT